MASVAENIASYGLTGRLVSIDQMAVERGAFLDRGFEDETTRATVVEAFRSAARQGVAKGAETVIPAGGIVMALLALANVAYLEEAPSDGAAALAAQLADVVGPLVQDRPDLVAGIRHQADIDPRGAEIAEAFQFVQIVRGAADRDWQRGGIASGNLGHLVLAPI